MIPAERRYVRGRRCPICGGADGDKRGAERRCFGFLSTDGLYAHCSREERAGGLKQSPGSQTYGHRLSGPCGCGTQHTEPVREQPAERRIVAIYGYHDESGQLVYQVVRFEPKSFRQRRPTPEHPERWIWNLEGVRRVLYHLDRVIEADPVQTVYVVEGEKDVEAIETLGLIATCNPQGAGKWSAVADCAAQALAGRNVVVIADADDKGRAHAADVAAQLGGVAVSVRTLELPGAKDAADWIRGGGTAEQLEALVAAPLAPAAIAGLITMSTVVPELVDWLWPARIPLSMITMVDGDPGLGKSTMTLDIAARVSRGRVMPFEAPRSRPAADVILLTAEDHLAATVRPRLDAAGADLHRVHVVQTMPRKDDPDRPPMLVAEDIARLEQIVIAKRAKLVIVDPIMAFLDAATDAHRDQDMRAVLRLIAATAERTGAAILVVRHLRKGAGSALYRGAGSIGIVGAARSALLVAADPDDPEQRVLAASKCNLAPLAPSLRWQLVDQGGVARVEWLGVADGVTADDLARVADPAGSDEGASDLDRAVEALREVLADGPVPTRQAMAAASELAGCSVRTVERARQRLGVEAVRVRTPDGRRVQRIDLRLTSTPPRLAVGGVEEA